LVIVIKPAINENSIEAQRILDKPIETIVRGGGRYFLCHGDKMIP